MCCNWSDTLHPIEVVIGILEEPVGIFRSRSSTSTTCKHPNYRDAAGKVSLMRTATIAPETRVSTATHQIAAARPKASASSLASKAPAA